MHTDDARAEARSRANRRLRNLTIGTAMLGIAATGGLGWAAALSFDGTVATTATTTTAAVTGNTAMGSSTAAATTGTSPAVVSATGNAHASTGGS